MIAFMIEPGRKVKRNLPAAGCGKFIGFELVNRN